jgi:hypothetical protein
MSLFKLRRWLVSGRISKMEPDKFDDKCLLCCYFLVVDGVFHGINTGSAAICMLLLINGPAFLFLSLVIIAFHLRLVFSFTTH